MGYARLQTADFSLDRVVSEMTDDRSGGVALYVGRVRGNDDGAVVTALEYEAFDEMAQGQLERVRAEAISKFSLLDATVIHRTGRLVAGQQVVLVACSAAHRAAALQACQWLIDEVKQRVPVWKQEVAPQGRTWILGGRREGP